MYSTKLEGKANISQGKEPEKKADNAHRLYGKTEIKVVPLPQ